MIDPLLGGFDMPITIEMRLAATDVRRVDRFLVTHSDSEHFRVPTCRDRAAVSDSDWHFGLAGAVTMANAYPTTPLWLHHWVGGRSGFPAVQRGPRRSCTAWSPTRNGSASPPRVNHPS